MRTARANIAGSITNQLGLSTIGNVSGYSVGKVFDVIMDDKTPSREVFKQYGEWGGIGTIFYLDYPTNKNVSNVRLIDCKVARNFFPNQKHIPLREELVLLFDLPSQDTQDNQYKNEKYYISVINLWNNNHHNSQPANNIITGDIKLGSVFTENSNINSLLPFEGDTIFEGRNGNSLRFSSTTKFNTDENFWSITGNNGDPITLITNGHDFQPDSLKPYVENPNLDKSSIYLTSTQKIPLRVRTLKPNKLFNPISPEIYINSQVILSGDRIVLNSKNDEILLYANGIGLSSSNTIYLNSSKDILLEAPKIILGLDSSGDVAVEPLLKGNETVKLLSHIIKELKNLSTQLSSVVSTPPGTPLISINKAGLSLITSLNYITTETQDLQTLLSSKSYTI
jgi:hypothetical protein